MSRVVVSSAEVRIRARGRDRNQTVVEAQDLVDIAGATDYIQSAKLITDYEERLQDDCNVDFGTHTANYIVAEAGAKCSLNANLLL